MQRQGVSIMVLGVVCLAVGIGLNGTTHAQDAVEAAPIAEIETWLDRAADRLVTIPSNEEAYTITDMAYLVLELEARYGQRPDRVMALFGQLQMATSKLAVMEGSAWSSCYLPSGQYLVGNRDAAERTVENMGFDLMIQLDAWQMMAGAASAMDNEDDYVAYFENTLALFPQVVAEGVVLAAETDFIYGGTYVGWYAADTMRRHHNGDLDRLERLCGIGLVEPMEQAGIWAVKSQLEMCLGETEAARESLNIAIKFVENANATKQAATGDIWTDSINGVTETVAAKWVLDGAEAAIKLGAILEVPYEDAIEWEFGAAIQAADTFSQMGDNEAAAAALNMALDSHDPNEDLGWYDGYMLAYQLVRQGRRDEAIALAEGEGSVRFRALATIGVAEALLDQGAH